MDKERRCSNSGPTNAGHLGTTKKWYVLKAPLPKCLCLPCQPPAIDLWQGLGRRT